MNGGKGMRVNAGNMRGVGRLFVAAVVFVLSTSAAGQTQDIPGYPVNVYDGDSREMAFLPKYCIYTQAFRDTVPGGLDRAMIDAWTAQMGPIFHAMHHYCAGLIKVRRGMVLARDPTTRRFFLSDAIIEYDYVIKRAPDDFVLLPEIITKKGEILVQLGKAPSAVYQFERAIELKPDYWPPYAHLSDHYKESGDVRKAREVLDAGLAKVPDAKALQRRVAELDAPPNRSTKR